MERFATTVSFVKLQTTKPKSFRKDAEKMHNFTKFAIELNEFEDELPPTDSRLRPDQRLMEEGKWPQANEIKQKLEEAQRERRKQREDNGNGS